MERPDIKLTEPACLPLPPAIRTDPACPCSEAPTDNIMSPEDPDPATPEVIVTDPLGPAVAPPVARLREPLPAGEVAELICTAPLLSWWLNPLLRTIFPPTPALDNPPFRDKSPPTDWPFKPSPPDTVTDPPLETPSTAEPPLMSTTPPERP
jgi:hypothetical protein